MMVDRDASSSLATGCAGCSPAAGIEIVVEVRDGKGNPLPGAYVIGSSKDWTSAERDFGAVACGPAQANVNGRTILRKDCLRQ